MTSCAALATRLKILEHLLTTTSNQQRRQEILDAIDDTKAQQQSQGCLNATNTNFTSTATLWTTDSDASGRGPFMETIHAEFAFPTSDPTHFNTSLVISPTDAVTVSVNSISQGTYDVNNQRMEFDVGLHFDFHVPGAASDGDFLLTTTGSITLPDGTVRSGQFPDKAGHVIFVATTTFTKGHWDGVSGFLLVDGYLSPWPAV